MFRIVLNIRYFYALFCLCLSLTSIGCDQQNEDSNLDETELLELGKEIAALSASIDCVNASDWKFTAMGSKACGGPAGYIAYSSQIDTVSFLEKVQKYTEAQRDYNEKNDIISDCSIENAAVGVVCQDNKAVLIYNRCELIPDSGICEAAITRFYFDQEAQECKEFIWGGCDGVVPFETLEACKICE